MTGLLPFLRAVAANNYINPAVLEESTLRWITHAGLGPLFSHMAQNQRQANTGFVMPSLLSSADMAARVAMADYLDSLEEILAASADIAQEITLLKGISVCQHLYPEPHLRTMGDIDLLVPKNKQELLESLLLSLGYHQQSSQTAEFYATHHHSMPFFHPEKHTWVEVHSALLSNRNVASDRVFSSSHVASQIVPTTFRGHRTNRLNYEQEMIYIATHWALERKCFAGGVIPLVDMIYLVQKHGHEFNWDNLFGALKGSQATVYLYLMLQFLQKNGMVSLPPTLMRRLASAQSYPLGLSEPILLNLIDRYSIQGRRPSRLTSETIVGTIWETLLKAGPAWKNILRTPWNILFTPTQPRRFSPAFQLARISRMLGLRKQP